jgi:hypothetical protein
MSERIVLIVLESIGFGELLDFDKIEKSFSLPFFVCRHCGLLHQNDDKIVGKRHYGRTLANDRHNFENPIPCVSEKSNRRV